MVDTYMWGLASLFGGLHTARDHRKWYSEWRKMVLNRSLITDRASLSRGATKLALKRYASVEHNLFGGRGGRPSPQPGGIVTSVSWPRPAASAATTRPSETHRNTFPKQKC
ncbi:unnamed protein product, partial [Iphiclides podalirius]